MPGRILTRGAISLFAAHSCSCCCLLVPALLCLTDSTIAPPQNQRYSLTNVSRLLDKKKYTIEKEAPMWYFVCKGLSIDDVRVSRDIAVFQEKRPEAGFETGDFAKEKLGGGGYRRTTTCLIYTCVKQGYRRTTRV